MVSVFWAFARDLLFSSHSLRWIRVDRTGPVCGDADSFSVGTFVRRWGLPTGSRRIWIVLGGLILCLLMGAVNISEKLVCHLELFFQILEFRCWIGGGWCTRGLSRIVRMDIWLANGLLRPRRWSWPSIVPKAWRVWLWRSRK
jgi:hypothetical protein